MDEIKRDIIPKNKRDTAAYRYLVLSYVKAHPDSICVRDAMDELHITRKTIQYWLRMLEAEGMQLPPQRRKKKERLKSEKYIKICNYLHANNYTVSSLKTVSEELSINYHTLNDYVGIMRAEGMEITVLSSKRRKK